MNRIYFVDLDENLLRFDEKSPKSAICAQISQRKIQYMRKIGKTACIFYDCDKDPGEALPLLSILEDIDGSKIIAYRYPYQIELKPEDCKAVFASLRKCRDEVNMPLIFLYSSMQYYDENTLAYLHGVVDGSDDMEFIRADDYFQLILEGMYDLPVIKIDKDKKYPDFFFDLSPTDEEAPSFLPAENIMYGPEIPYFISRQNIRPTVHSRVQMHEGKTVLSLLETAGEETECFITCPAYDFAFSALFSPFECKIFEINNETGKVTEIMYLERI